MSLVVGFLLFNVLVVGARRDLGVPVASRSWSACSGSWSRRSRSSFIFVLMRGTLPRVRIDQLMGFAWKWLVPAALLNIFVTAGAILVITGAARHADEDRPRPGLGIAKGIAFAFTQALPAQGDDPVPGGASTRSRRATAAG